MSRVSSRSLVANRTLTIAAAGLLAFDGAALLFASVWLGRVLPGVIGGCLILSSGLVFVYWTHHRRQLVDIAGSRRAVRDQARAFRNMIQRN